MKEEHRARLEELYARSIQTLDSVDLPSRLHNLQHLYSVWNQSLAVQLKSAPPKNPKSDGPGGQKNGDFYANVGNAIRTLRQEIPLLFQEEFTCATLTTLPPVSGSRAVGMLQETERSVR